MRHDFKIEIGSFGRDSDEEWEKIEPTVIDFWTKAIPLLKSRTYKHDGVETTVELDWSPYNRSLKNYHKVMAPVRRAEPSDPAWYSKINRSTKLSATCHLNASNKLSANSWYAEFFLEYYLYEVFLIANLACPGAANFFSLRVGSGLRKAKDKFDLSSFYFDQWMVSSFKGQDVKASLIDVNDVVSWVQTANPTVTQRAETNIQRALFSVLHVCHSDGQIEFVVWLFTALESLLNTKVGENFSGMVRRASIVLKLDDRERKRLSSRLRKLYDLRSSFVHGGYPVAHPMHVETIDRRLDKDFSNILELSQYGFNLLGAILQVMVREKRLELNFEERLASEANDK
jgi:Apea-like HEPN